MNSFNVAHNTSDNMHVDRRAYTYNWPVNENKSTAVQCIECGFAVNLHLIRMWFEYAYAMTEFANAFQSPRLSLLVNSACRVFCGFISKQTHKPKYKIWDSTGWNAAKCDTKNRFLQFASELIVHWNWYSGLIFVSFCFIPISRLKSIKKRYCKMEY